MGHLQICPIEARIDPGVVALDQTGGEADPSLLSLWEKVAIGGLRPPSFKRTPMLCIGYAKSVPDEGLRPIGRKRPLTRLRFAKPPSPTRGEGKKASDAIPHSIRRPAAVAANAPAPAPLRAPAPCSWKSESRSRGNADAGSARRSAVHFHRYCRRQSASPWRPRERAIDGCGRSPVRARARGNEL